MAPARSRHPRIALNEPRPVRARLPVWIGGVGPKTTLPLVARHGDGWNAAYVSPERFAELGRAVDAACERVDRDPATVRRAVNVLFNLSAEEAGARRAEDALRDQWGAAFERIAGGALLGTPEQAVEQLVAFVAAGATDVNIALRAPWDEDALTAYPRRGGAGGPCRRGRGMIPDLLTDRAGCRVGDCGDTNRAAAPGLNRLRIR